MRAKVFYTVMSVVGLFVFVFVPVARADLEAVYTVDSLFTAVNAGELDAASDLFAEDAIAGYVLTNQTYEGSDEISAFLDDLHYEGREYEVVQLTMVGDVFELTLDIADRGHVWGQQKVQVEMEKGMIQRLIVLETRLTLWRISG